MAKRTHVLKVKNGEYKAQDGSMKARWVDVGSIVKNEKGSMLFINRMFNPAGVPGDPSDDSILVSMFKVDDEPRPQAPPADDIGGDDIPF